MNLNGKRIVITGASSGIGATLAMQLAHKGAHLALGARSESKLAEVAAECRSAGARAETCPTDVTNPEQCRRLVETALDRLGGIDVLIHSAGTSMWARFEEITDLSVFERIMRVNYLGAVHTTYFALDPLRQSRGMIVGISSLTGLTGVPTRSAYAASKHALQGFLDSIRIELRRDGVNVLVVSPGLVATSVRSAALGPDGRPVGNRRGYEEAIAMPVDVCVRKIVRAMERERRELVMTGKARVGRWVKLVLPGLIDRVAERSVTDTMRAVEAAGNVAHGTE